MNLYRCYLVPMLCLTASMLIASRPASDSGGAGSEYDGVVLPAESTGNKLPDTALITIHVDEQNPIKPFSRDIFGFNYDWDLTQSLVMPGDATEADPEVLSKLAAIRFPLNRVAGSDSKRFRWKDAIGDASARPAQKLWDWSKGVPVLFGPVEWIRWVQQADTDATFSWVVNLNESPEDIRDLAEFLLATPAKSAGKDDGIDWSARRVELGIPDPVKISIWEIGNEMDLGDDSRRWSVERYIAAAGPAIDAIRSVDPDAVIAIHSTSSPWAPPRAGRQPWRNWHREVLRALGDKVDILVFHPYYNGIPLSQVEGFMDVMSDDIKAITGSDRIKLYHSEHAVWPPMPVDGNWRKNWYQTHSLGGTLNTALFLTLCLNRTDTVAAAYHSFHSGPWGLIYRDAESKELFTTGIAAMFELFGEIDGDAVLPVQIFIDGKEVSQKELRPRLGVAAVKHDDVLQVIVVNRDNASAEFSFAVGAGYSVRTVKILSGADVSLSNTISETPLGVEEIQWSDVGKSIADSHRMTLPALSLSLVTFTSEK